jgi:thioredoxin reductase (NADPH)
MRETTKEALLEIERRTGLHIQYNERVEAITPADEGGFVVQTSRSRYRTRTVLLAIGRRGSPRKLGVPGEDLPNVVYRLIDPVQYDGKRVLVVGGGDSALEAAAALAERPGTTVTLAYRGQALSRARASNRERVRAAEASQRLSVMLDAQVVGIDPTATVITQGGANKHVPVDAVIVCTGGILPTQLLRDIGIQVHTKYGSV